MLFLSEVRDCIAQLGIVDNENVYSGRLDSKKDESIGVYNNRRGSPKINTVGVDKLRSYSVKAISILIHWNKRQRDTERKAYEVYTVLSNIRNVTVNGKRILFTDMKMEEPVDVGTDDNGIYEMVIELDFYYERQEAE